jgi:hypothetical protein
MSPTPTLYQISRSDDLGALTVTQAWQQGNDQLVPDGCHQIRALPDGDSMYLVCALAAGDASVLQATAAPPFLAANDAKLAIKGPWDQLEPFTLGNDPYLLAYTAKNGNMWIYPVAGLVAATPCQFYRKRPPAITVGLDMLTPVVVLGEVFFMGYIKATGDVRAWSLSVTATTLPSLPGTPPLLVQPVWDHQWAPDWTQFAFFYLGGEVFFFKINVGPVENVNIDHLLDNPALGTVEVGSLLQGQLPDALQVTIARSFYIDGDPYLLLYKSDGSGDFYRVRGDCQGWTKQASLPAAMPGVTEIVCYQAGGNTFALFA